MDLDTILASLQIYTEVVIRLSLAAILGGLFGLEREVRGREAGLRTNILISVSSCLFTYLGVETFPYFEDSVRDPARIAAQIVSGVGFLGAGALLVYKNKVRGLTTAATIWLVAAVGMAAGVGAYFAAIFTSLMALATLVLLAPLSHRLELRAREMRAARRTLSKLTGEAEETETSDFWLEEDTD